MVDARRRPVAHIHPAVVASIHDDGLVLFHTENGRLFAANSTGARIWQCVEQRLTVEDAAVEISRDYQIDQQAAREHAANFLIELHRQGLVTLDSDR